MGDQQSIWLGRARKMDQLLAAVLKVDLRKLDPASLHRTATGPRGRAKLRKEESSTKLRLLSLPNSIDKTTVRCKLSS
jgi:hypothetical protein